MVREVEVNLNEAETDLEIDEIEVTLDPITSIEMCIDEIEDVVTELDQAAEMLADTPRSWEDINDMLEQSALRIQNAAEYIREQHEKEQKAELEVEPLHQGSEEEFNQLVETVQIDKTKGDV